MSQIHEEADLEKNNPTVVTEDKGEVMEGEPNWSRHPQKTTEPSGSKEVPMETVAVTEVTLQADSICSEDGLKHLKG